MWRAITGFHLDEQDEWVAELACGHNQHVRHDPPLFARSWVLDPAERASHLGTPLDCLRCDRAELPIDARPSGIRAVWDRRSMPDILRRRHTLWPGTWAQITVEHGTVQFRADAPVAARVALGPGAQRAIPPEVPHALEPDALARFLIEFYSVSRPAQRPGMAAVVSTTNDQGGDPACWRAMVCPECGQVLDRTPDPCPCTCTPPAKPHDAADM